MLAARDQENRVFGHQAGAAAKQHGLQPKTPGAKFPKTPLKVPLNDENAVHVLGGKSVLGQRANGGNENIRTVGKGAKAVEKSNLVTPLEPRTARAPLGNKTTNAKARTGLATGGVKERIQEFEKSQAPPTTARRPKILSPQAGAFKLEVHNENELDGSDEEDIEYAPPREREAPYESDVFPEGVLNFDAFKPENRLKGYYDYYYNKVDDNGVSLKEKEFAEQQRRAFEKLDQRILQDLEEFDWTVGDIPESKDFFKKRQAKNQSGNAEAATAVAAAPAQKSSTSSCLAMRQPPTIASRRAASALSMAPPKPAVSALQPKAVKPVNSKKTSFLIPGKKPVAAERPASATLLRTTQPRANVSAEVASRTTLGYSKGRSASSMVHGRGNASTVKTAAPVVNNSARSTSSLASSRSSEATLTPARFAQAQAKAQAQAPAQPAKHDDGEELRRLDFLSIFDADDEAGDLTASTPVFSHDDTDDDEVHLELQF